MCTTTWIVLGLAALGAAAPIEASANPSVRIMTYDQDNCGGAGSFLFVDRDVCLNFAGNVKSLKVIGHDGEVKYNALNVYSAENCASGPVLQPVLNTECSAVVAYNSIKLAVDTPKA